MGLLELCIACVACAIVCVLFAKLIAMRRRRRRTMPVPEHRRRGVALHEAAHAVADAVEFGPEIVKELCVHGALSEDDDHFGYVITAFPQHASSVTLEIVRRRAMSVLAGRASDELFLGAPHSGSADDLETANEMFFAAYARCGFGGTLVTYPNEYFEPSGDMRTWVEHELQEAYANAKRLVSANSHVIEALANRVLDEEPVDGLHVLSATDLEEFFRGHALERPDPPE